MAENKTVPNDLSVDAYIDAIVHPQRKKDCKAILELMKSISGKEPKMWGTSIVGFGKCHYKYESGREGDMPCIGFSNRQQAITLYLLNGFKNQNELLKRIGKHKRGKVCFYIKRLSDIDIEVLSTVISECLKKVERTYTILE